MRRILTKTEDITKWVGTLEKPHRIGHTFVFASICCQEKLNFLFSDKKIT